MFSYLEPNKTCVLVNNKKIIYESIENSVKPLVKYIFHNGIPKSGTILIDKIVGFAIANIILYCNIKTVYAKVISKPALKLLEENQIEVYFEEVVENILRYDKKDICPMEKKILSVSSPLEAYNILVQIIIYNNPLHL